MEYRISDEETERLLQELASATGVSSAIAIKEAVRERLARVRQEKQVDETVDRVRALLESFGRRPRPMTQAEIDDWMYDENGLPR
jgi:hypothetical protein